MQIVAQRPLLSNSYSCDSGFSLTTFLEFLSHTLVHKCILNFFWSYYPCRQTNWETWKLCNLMSVTFLEPLMEVRLLLHTVSTLRQCSHQWLILVLPYRLFQLGLHQVSPYLTQYFRGTFPSLTEFWPFCAAIFYFLELCTKLLRKRENPHSVYITAHCTWNCRLRHILVCAKPFHKYRQLKVDFKCDLSFWPSLAPRSFDRDMCPEFNIIKVGTISLLSFCR